MFFQSPFKSNIYIVLYNVFVNVVLTLILHVKRSFWLRAT